MKRKILALVMTAVLVVGCAGKSDDGVTRLSKTEYTKQVKVKFEEMQKISSKMSSSSDKGAFIDKANKLVDEIIDLNGPKKDEAKEKAVDDALTSYKKILDSAKNIDTDTTKQQKYLTDLQKVVLELQTAMGAYFK